MDDQPPASWLPPDRLDDHPRAAAVAKTARALFEAGDFAAARTAFNRAFALGDTAVDTIVALQTLLAEAGEHAEVARVLASYLDRAGPDLPARDRATWAAALFDATRIAGSAVDEAAQRLLEAAAAAGEPGWELVLEPARRAAIITAFDSPGATLERLEQEGYAPTATGLPTQAIVEAETIGFRHAAEPAIARAAERLLHALGAREAAYRVEAARRVPDRRPDRDRRQRVLTPPDRRGLVVLIAGGHAPLRAAVRADLRRAGISQVRALPPAWEATRSGRAVRDLLAGVDVAVLIGRQLDHNTADRVRALATGIGIPVVAARTASLGAVRAAIEAYAGAPSERS